MWIKILMSIEVFMTFQEFLEGFVPKLKEKSKQVNQVAWILETTGILM